MEHEQKTGKHHIIIMILVIGLVAVSVLLAMRDTPSSKQDVQNTIAVSGNAELTVAPNKAEIYIGMETFGRTAKDAQDANQIKADAVYAALKNAGVKESEIETTQYYLQPRYQWDPNTGKSSIDGYTLSHQIKVTTTKLEDAGLFVDEAIKAGANQLNNIQFSLTKEKELEVNEEALQMAGERAKEKASSIARGLNVKLGNIVTVSESNTGITPYYYTAGMDAAESRGGELKTVISPEQVKVSATVNIVYGIG